MKVAVNLKKEDEMNHNKVRALQLRRAENQELLDVAKRVMQADLDIGNPLSASVARVAVDTTKRIQQIDSQIDGLIK